MNNEIQVFNFNGADVRTQVIDSEPVFCLSDVCKVLGISNVGNCKSRLTEKGIRTMDTPTAGGVQSMTYISEQNLYKVIFQSRKPEAEAFTDWVTGEVLPAIRRTGGYMAARPDEKPEEIMARALLLAKDTMDRQAARIAEQETRIAEQSRQIAEKTEALAAAAPKAAFVDNFCVSTGTILVRDFAKHIAQALGLKGFGEKVLFAYLKENGYLNMNRYPTQYATDLGLFRVYEGIHQHNDGSTGLHHCSRITPKGQTYLYGKLKSQYEANGRWW